MWIAAHISKGLLFEMQNTWDCEGHIDHTSIIWKDETIHAI